MNKLNNILFNRSMLMSTVFVMMMGTLFAQADENVLSNGNFESGTGGWVLYGAAVDYKTAFDGRKSLKISQNSGEWVGAHQYIPLGDAKTVVIRGGVKTVDVKPGKEGWMKARIGVDFVDGAENNVYLPGQNYTAPVVDGSGTSDWTYMEQSYIVPPGADQLKVSTVLAHCNGTAYFDEIEVYLSDVDERLQYANQLRSGGFESSAGWSIYGGTISPEDVQEGNLAFKVSQEADGWVGGHQEIELKDYEEWDEIVISYKMKTVDVVKGDLDWKQARLGVDFTDANGGAVGGFMPPVGQAVGTTEWTTYEYTYARPKTATKIKLSPVLAHCSGTAYFDDITFKGGKKAVYEADSDEEICKNGLQNPGFEKQLSKWAGGLIEKEIVKSGKASLKLTLQSPNWQGCEQLIIMPEGADKLDISTWIKTDNVVAGAQSYERARIEIVFTDNNGAMVGGYQHGMCNVAGTTDWSPCNGSYDIPKGATILKINAQLANVSGTAYYDDFQVKYYSNGKSVCPGSQKKDGPTNTGDWYLVEADPTSYNTHWVDWSSLLDAPAGKHGFVQAKGDDFFFENGKRAKFWGVNIVAADNFPTKKRAEEVAERLAKMGCNVARMHHMDAPWSVPNIFGNKENSTRSLDPEMLDRFDYFVSALKKRGIYIYLDLLVHRQFKEGDGVIAVPQENGAKQVGHFDRTLIDLQKEFAKQMITHTNKYTGLSYANEPAVMGSIITNESTMFFYFNGDVMNKQYREGLQKRFEAFTGKPELKLAVFDFNYGTYGGMNTLQGNPEEVEQTIKFYKKLEYEYYEELGAYIKNDLGAKFPVAGTNFPLPQTTYQEVNATAKGLDFVATNNYWDHPKVFLLNNDWSRQLYAPIDNNSLLKNPVRSLTNHFSKYQVYDKPFVVTEYNACFPNEWKLEAIPMVSMYAALQGIDGLCQFDFRVEPVGMQSMQQAFSASKQPDHLGNWVIAAPVMLGEGYITEAPSRVVDPVSAKETDQAPAYNNFLDKNAHLSYITKVAASYDGTAESKASDFDKYVKDGVYSSETGELSLDPDKGIMLATAPKVQGVTGAINDRKFDLPFVSIEASNMWASCVLVSKDGKPLAESKNFYIVAVTPSRQSGMKFNDQRTQVDVLGDVPWEAQYFDGTVTLNTDKNITVTPLTINGKEMPQLSTSKVGGKSVIDMKQAKSYILEVKVN